MSVLTIICQLLVFWGTIFIALALGFIPSFDVNGAACCGPTPLFPTILLGGESGQVTIQYQKLTSSFYIDPTGQWIPYSDLIITSYRLDSVWRNDDDWQVSISLPTLSESGGSGCE